MKLWFAPMEGITDSIYRRVHAECFGGVEKYYMPFVSPSSHLCFTSRQTRELDPAENAGIDAIPQVLTRDAAQFMWMAEALGEAGYHEINLNLGCPFGTVTAKGKGSGFLRDPAALRVFLDEIFSHASIPISVKTRIGFESEREWPSLKELLCAYPFSALIIHPRTRAQFYRGQPHEEALQADFGQQNVVWNGDLFTKADYEARKTDLPQLDTFMLGRGMIANPALAREIRGGDRLCPKELYRFHERLLAAYMSRWPQNAVLGHMHEIMRYMLDCFEESPHARRLIRKAKTLDDYRNAVDLLFEQGRFRASPGFRPFD